MGFRIIPSDQLTAKEDIITVYNNHTGHSYLSFCRTFKSTLPLLLPWRLPSIGSSCFSHSQISQPHHNISIILQAASGDGRWIMWGRELVLGLLRMNSRKETLTIVVNRISQPSNRTHTSVNSLLICVSFNIAVSLIPTISPKSWHPQCTPILLWYHTSLGMITASEGDAWMGLKCPREEKVHIGISWCRC